ncbi:MAG TPA: ATP-binding protein [Mollicutes bacterium]|nr:ATP-binding protein [Mollicutes bacterium]
MLGKVIAIENSVVEVALNENIKEVKNLLNYHVVFEETNFNIIGEIKDFSIGKMKVTLLGEMVNNIFLAGTVRRPSLDSPCRIIKKEELDIIVGNVVSPNTKKLYIGTMPLYGNYPINININNFFAHHFSIFGNTGSGKSYSVTRMLQNLFTHTNSIPDKAKIFIFDAYGEYHNAFKNINTISPSLNFKTYTTNLNFPDTEILNIPLWFLGVDDIALLLGADNHIQIPIIEKALKLVGIFVRQDEKAIEYKNDIIARALLDVLYSGNSAGQIRDHLIAILSSFNTKELSLETKLVQPGYVRTLRQCLIIDKDGKLHEIQLIAEFLSKFLKEGLELSLPDGSFAYNLNDLKDAFDFALISEGVLNSDKVYDYANILKVRLHSLINSDDRRYFEHESYITKEQYIKNLSNTIGGSAQIINFNINYIDDRLAKTITKIFAKLFYDFVTTLDNKASYPIHIILEEAHRYVQNDNDQFLLGYNIFDRITKEGRKYGILLGLISQRPSELSETALSQCSNFLIFKMVHPKDTDYVRNMVPNITNEIVEKLKTLQPGTCIAFGNAFKIPIVIRFDLPNPPPESSNTDIANVWF